MKEYLGIVASGSNREQIVMYSKKNINTDYIATENKNKYRYLFEIVSIETINEKLKDVEYFRIMLEEDNYSKYNIFKIEAQFIGVLKDGKIANDLYYIAEPGAKIYSVTEEEIMKIYDIDKDEEKIKIGNLLRENAINVNLNFNRLFSTHASVLGRTGSGKTFFMKHLLNKMKSDYIIISPTDEYNSLSDNIYDDGNIPIGIGIENCKKTLGLNDSELAFLKEYCSEHRTTGTIRSIDLADNIMSFYGRKTNSNWQPSLFGDSAKRNIEVHRYVLSLCEKLEQVKININIGVKNELNVLPVIFSTQDLPEKTESIAVYLLLNRILNARIKKFRIGMEKQNDVFIILEEAHQYAPSVKTTMCKDIIIQIARVGRKYGLHLLVLSQRPRHIDQTLLSQCGTNIIFNLSNPQDIDYVMEHSCSYSEKNKSTIRNLKTGTCLITSNTRDRDIVCKISF